MAPPPWLVQVNCTSDVPPAAVWVTENAVVVCAIAIAVVVVAFFLGHCSAARARHRAELLELQEVDVGQDEVDEAIIEEVRRQVGGKKIRQVMAVAEEAEERAREAEARLARMEETRRQERLEAGRRVQELRDEVERAQSASAVGLLTNAAAATATPELLELARAEWGAAPPSAMSAGTDEADEPAPEERRQPRGARSERRARRERGAR